MKKEIGAVCIGALAAAIFGGPARVNAETLQQSFNLQTRMVEQQPGVGEFDGSLQITISPRGIVTGYYRPDDNARFIPVDGGLTGDKLWLDIGAFARHPMRFSGTLRGGKIDAVSDQPLLDDGSYAALELFGTPAKI